MMGKNHRFPSKYAGPQSEGSGSLDHIYSAKDSAALMRKWIDLNSASRDGFAIPIQTFPLSQLSSFERKNLVLRLTSELEQIRHLQKKVECQAEKLPNAIAVSSNILSETNAHYKGLLVSAAKKPFGLVSGHGKKMSSLNRGHKGSSESANQITCLNPHARLLKQCENLLKKLMSQDYAWVFNTPVDVVKLNIPDYFNVVKNPMDLGTIKSKLAAGKYSNPLDFLADVRLTFINAKTYNPPGTDVHFMADSMNQFFELRWKAIEKKLVTDSQSLLEKTGIHAESEAVTSLDFIKKRKLSPVQNEVKQPVNQKMTDEERHKLGTELEDLLSDLPDSIIEFLRAQSTSGGEDREDEVEIDIDDLSDDTLFTLRKLLNDHVLEKKKNHAKSEVCEMELPNVSGPSNSSLQADKEDIDDADIGGNEAPVTSYHPLQFDKDAGEEGLEHRTTSENGSECSKGAFGRKQGQVDVAVTIDSTGSDNKLVDEHCDIIHVGSQVSPDKLYRAAVLKNRFADTILKAQEKTLGPEDKGDPEKLRREREELEVHKRREKARLQAEAKAAEDARRRAQVEAEAELKKRRDLEREAAREALLKMEKTVEINEYCRFVEDHPSDGFGDFNFGGNNPLEQLGLYMKVEEDDEDGEPPNIHNGMDDVEEGEID